MSNLRDIRKRIKSINNTAKVTHAMELVAAAKMRKSQEATLSSRPYTNTLAEILGEVRTNLGSQVHALLSTNEARGGLLIVVATDRGLVSGLNLNVFREIIKGEFRDAKFITVGKKGLQLLAKSGANIMASFMSEEMEIIDLARGLTKLAIDAFMKSEVAWVKVIYPEFVSTLKQIPTLVQLLPIYFNNQETATLKAGMAENLIFEPSADQILEGILPHFVLTKVYQALLEAKASEHSARMVAMKNATDAASDLVSDLTLAYNQARQEAITKELLDIITAQAAIG